MKKSPATTEPDLLTLKAPIDSWDEALPLGNGLLGLLLWKGDGQIQISLDRVDLWDTRTPKPFTRKDWNWPNLLRLIQKKNWSEVSRRFGEIYAKFPYPTKLPAGRLFINLPRGQKVDRFVLDRSTGVGSAHWRGGGMESFCEADGEVICLRFRGEGISWNLEAPPYTVNEGQAGSGMSGADLTTLGYAAASRRKSPDQQSFCQPTVSDGAFSAVVLTKARGPWTELYLSVQPGLDVSSAYQNAVTKAQEARERGWRRISTSHRGQWTEFWQRSSVSIPDPTLQDLYQQASYLLGSASRPGGLPISLQAVWTADDGKLPPWKGDYHHNVNTQMCYWPHLTAGHADRMRGFLDHMWSLAGKHRALAKRFFAADGIFVPGAMALDGQLIGGYAQVSYSATNGAWVANMFYQYWKYTGDEQYLRAQGYPYCAGIGDFLLSMLQEGVDGKLKLPVSASPEIHEGGPDGWVEPNSHYDLSLMHWLFGALIEMAEALGEDGTKWRTLLAQLDRLPVGKMTEDELPREGAGPFLIAPGKALHQSHRHHSHLMAVYPLGLATKDGEYKETIEQSLRQIDRLGTGLWVGFSFPWMACIAARVGQAERARQALTHFAESFVSSNGFHLNGDFRKRGLSWWNYRPFTIEANFAYLEAVHEMLLQSGDTVVRIFPAVPVSWLDVSFRKLRAVGGLVVSASREDGATEFVEITTTRDHTFILENPFRAKGEWNLPLRIKAHGRIECSLKAGETLHGKRIVAG